jgi:hypothetical protein
MEEFKQTSVLGIKYVHKRTFCMKKKSQFAFEMVNFSYKEFKQTSVLGIKKGKGSWCASKLNCQY